MLFVQSRQLVAWFVLKWVVVRVSVYVPPKKSAVEFSITPSINRKHLIKNYELWKQLSGCYFRAWNTSNRTLPHAISCLMHCLLLLKPHVHVMCYTCSHCLHSFSHFIAYFPTIKILSHNIFCNNWNKVKDNVK